VVSPRDECGGEASKRVLSLIGRFSHNNYVTALNKPFFAFLFWLSLAKMNLPAQLSGLRE
jgi:hypothetical protein